MVKSRLLDVWIRDYINKSMSRYRSPTMCRYNIVGHTISPRRHQTYFNGPKLAIADRQIYDARKAGECPCVSRL